MTEDTTNAVQNKLKKIANNLHSQCSISKNVNVYITATGGAPGKLQDNPKLHKTGVPLRTKVNGKINQQKKWQRSLRISYVRTWRHFRSIYGDRLLLGYELCIQLHGVLGEGTFLLVISSSNSILAVRRWRMGPLDPWCWGPWRILQCWKPNTPDNSTWAPVCDWQDRVPRRPHHPRRLPDHRPLHKTFRQAPVFTQRLLTSVIYIESYPIRSECES